MTEEVIRSWQSILRRDVGPDQHLFEDLGVESLEILELLEAMTEDFGVYLTVEQLYENPTPKALATLLSDQHAPGK